MKRLCCLLMLFTPLLVSCFSNIYADIATEKSGVPTVFAKTQTQTEEDVFPVSSEDIISTGISVPSGDKEGIAVWAEEWIKQYYKNNELYEVKAEPVYPPSKVFSKNILPGMTVGCDTYKVSFKQGVQNAGLPEDAEGKISREVWVFWIDDGEKINFSSVQWAGIQWDYNYYGNTYGVLYDEIEKDSRFSSLINPMIHTTMDKGIKEYNANGSNSSMYAPVLITEGVVAYTLKKGWGEDGLIIFDLYIYDYINDKILHTLSFEEKGYPELSVKDGYILLDIDYREGDFNINQSGRIDPKDDPMVTLKRIIDIDGNIINETVSSTYVRKYYLDGGACILWKENSLYLLDETTGNEKLLIKGVFSSDKDVEYCSYVTGVDENRFIYLIGGYEWIIRSGVYDITTFTDNAFTYKGDVLGFYPLAYANGHIYASYHPLDGSMPADEIYMGDINEGFELSMPCENKSGLDDRNIISLTMASPDGSSVCAVAENGFGVTVLVYNDLGLIKSWDIETMKCNSPSQLLSFTDDKIILFGNGGCIYEIELF